MTRRARIALLVLGAWAAGGALWAGPARPAAGAPVVPMATRDSLPRWLAPYAAGPLARAHWGVAVYDLDAGRWVLEHAADRFFVPASNLKLVVSAVGLERLGPGFTYRTSVYGTAPIAADGTLDGDLVLYGRGDPNLSGRHAPTMTAILEALADTLLTRGLRRVSGEILADQSHWDDDPVRGDWSAYDLLWWYAAPVGALGFNDNSIDFRIRPGDRVSDPPLIVPDPPSGFYTFENRATTGPPGASKTLDFTRTPGTNLIQAYGVLPLDAAPHTEYFAVVDPAAWTGTMFREILAARGIDARGAVRTVRDAAASPVAAGDTIPLAAHVSPPLERVVEAINGRSQNWHAEQLLKTIGREVRGEGSWAAGLAVERAALAAMGVDTNAFVLRDASGLSAANLATPRGLVTLLARMRERPQGGRFAASLPVAGESGSLRRRFGGTVGAGRVRAKTGFIEHVHALSGYLTGADGHEYAFSILVNGAAGDGVTDAIDRLVNAIVSGAVP